MSVLIHSMTAVMARQNLCLFSYSMADLFRSTLMYNISILSKSPVDYDTF